MFIQTISQEPMQLGSPNVTYECSTMSPGNPLIWGLKGQKTRSQRVSAFRQNALLPLLRT